MIKFGSYDYTAMTAPPKMIKTIDLNSWNLNTDQMMIGNKVMISGNRRFDIDPMLPYLYVPDNDFLPMIEEFAKMYLD
jgi:hypothetical protein